MRPSTKVELEELRAMQAHSPRRWCEICGELYTLTTSGKLPRHRAPMRGSTLDNANVCDGSGEFGVMRKPGGNHGNV